MMKMYYLQKEKEPNICQIIKWRQVLIINKYIIIQVQLK